jgi:DNA-binding NarL/FixJ family response regulator
MTIKVILVDDHHLFRLGLRAMLASAAGQESEISVVGEASEARQAFALIESTHADVVVLDLTLPDGDGIAVTREILRRDPRARVLVLTMQTNESFATRAFAAGATGYAMKSQGPDDILQAIRTVAGGHRYVSPQLPSHIGQTAFAPGPEKGEASSDPLESLSKREREVCDLILRGLSNQTTAEALCISIKTVETHRARINQKLGVHSTGQLIRLAALQGLITS